MHIPFWRTDQDRAAGTDGEIRTDLLCKLGSIITKHFVDMTVTPETVDPQNIYMAPIKLSWHDIFNPYVCGVAHLDDSYQDATTTNQNYTGYIRCYPANDTTNFKVEYVTGQIDMQERDLAADKYVWHTLKKLRKVTVFNQMPLLSSRSMNVPAKVKRINPYTYYGMLVFNDAPRGATPADTQVTIDIKQRFEEWEI